MSNDPASRSRARPISPASRIVPGTSMTSAPKRAHAARIGPGALSGRYTRTEAPALAPYAARATAALPALGTKNRRRPSSVARETATAIPRALNDPVGNPPSSFSATSTPAASGTSRSGRMGVEPSPSVTIASERRTGRSSRNRQIDGPRPRSAAAQARPSSRSSAYSAKSVWPHCGQVPTGRDGSHSVEHARQTRVFRSEPVSVTFPGPGRRAA